MAPKGGNAKKESGRAKKAENEAKKAASAEAEKVQHGAPCLLVSSTHPLLTRTGAQGGGEVESGVQV